MALPNNILDREFEKFRDGPEGPEVAVTSDTLATEATQQEIKGILGEILEKQTNVVNETVRELNFIVPFAMSKELKVGLTNFPNRFTVLLFNKSPDLIYWYEEPIFNPLEAFPIYPNQYYEWQYSDQKSIYVQSATTDLTVILVEGR